MQYFKYIINKIKRFSIIGKLSLIIIIIVLLIGIFPNILCTHVHNVPSGNSLESPSLNHILGTDDLGIDLWSQICYGARSTILVGLGTAFFAGIGGSIIGIVSGYLGGLVDKFIMRITDMIIILPQLPVMIVLGAFFGPSIKNIIFVLALFSWTGPARIIRSRILSIKQEKYIIAAKSYGAGFWYLLKNHFLPRILPLIAINIIKLASRAVVAEAGLAFLGLGDPTSKSWGLILNHSINFQGIYFTDYWKWWIISPLVAITVLIISIACISRDFEKIIDTKI